MRPALLALALALATAAAAQPTADRAAATALRLAGPVPVLADEPSTAYRTGSAIFMATNGSVLVSAGTLATVTLGAGFSCVSSGGCHRSRGSVDGLLVALGTVGGLVGAPLGIHVFGQEPEDYRGLIPYSGVRKGDAGRALAGAAAGTAVGLAVALAFSPSESDLQWLSVPVAQGVGAGLAVGLSPRSQRGASRGPRRAG